MRAIAAAIIATGLIRQEAMLIGYCFREIRALTLAGVEGRRELMGDLKAVFLSHGND